MPVLRRRSDKVDVLKHVPLFKGLSKKDLDAVARRADEVAVTEGTVLAEQGTMGNEFYLILQGSAAVRRNRRRIATLGQGDFLGEMSLLDGRARSATVVALEDSVLLVMHRRDFSALLDEVPRMARKMLVGMSERLREADKKLVG